MALNQRLELRQGQALVMTPQLQQAIKLLQMSNIELQAFVDQERGDLQSLVALELDNLASLLIINEGTVAGKFLHVGEVENERQRHGLSWAPSRGEATVERRLAFLNAFKSFLRSYSAKSG